MARTAGSWTVLGGLAVLAAMQTWGCDDPDVPTVGVLDVEGVLAALPEGVVVPAILRFEQSAIALKGATASWKNTNAPGTKDAARAAWAEAMRAWQELEAMQIGPLASSGTSPQGQDLRDAIYSWPTVNPCRVDQETVEAEWDSGTFFDDNLVNTYGLDALEHVLFSGEDNTCPGQIPINADGTWAALGPTGIETNRAAFADALAQQVLDDTTTLRAAWDDHRLDAATYGSDQEALNAVYDALFYLESGIQDLKLAEPLGVRTCTTDCLELVESRGLSDGSNIWLQHNLVGIQQLFTGGTGAGMDDILIATGRRDLSDEFIVALEAAQADIQTLPGPVDQSIIDNRERVERVFATVQLAADLLRGDLATTLALQIPVEAAGDND